MTRKNLKRMGMGLLCGFLLSSNINIYADTINVKHTTEDSIALLSSVNTFYKESINLNKTPSQTNAATIVKQTAFVSVDKTNINNRPSATGDVLFYLNLGHPVNIIYQNSDWYYIASEQGNGFVLKNNLSTEKPEQYAKVNVNVLNVRQEASIQSNKIGKVYLGSSYKVKEVLDEWVQIDTGNGSGYVYKSYVSLVDEQPALKTSAASNTSSLRQQVVDYAKQFVGNPYVWGGNSLTKGVDCSGFTQQVLKHFGININRTSYNQIKNGVRISKDELLPGDLVFYGYNNKISHVAMYIGNNQVIHARNPKYGITITSLTYGYSKPYIGATRVIFE